MVAIGRYFVFILSLAEMTLSDEITHEDIVNFLNKIFVLHNKYRKKHGVQPLTRTLEMNFLAAQILNDMFTGEHNNTYDGYGKNVYWKAHYNYAQLPSFEAETIFMDWYRKGRSYNYLYEPSDYESYKEFTQMLWKDTTTIGIAMKLTNDRYVVQIVYDPRGNIPGQYEMNVLQRPLLACDNIFHYDEYMYQNVKKNFEDYIFHLHNEARIKHEVAILRRDPQLDAFADELLNLMTTGRSRYDEMYGKNFILRKYNKKTILDKAEAEAIFLKWYNEELNDNYDDESSNKKPVKFTQILWRGTQTMGISMLNGRGYYRVLAYYNPSKHEDGFYRSDDDMPRNMEQGEPSSHIED